MSIRSWRAARRERIAAAERATEASREQHDRIAEQWDEVHHHADRARRERDRNHLTQLFYAIHQGD